MSLERLVHAQKSAIAVDPNDRLIDPSNSLEEQQAGSFEAAGAIPPPYQPTRLRSMYESSSSLRQCVEAYTANIDGHGFHLEPVIDLAGDDARENVRDALLVQRIMAHRSGATVKVKHPTEQEITAELERIRIEMLVEKFRITSFFDDCTNGEVSFARLRADVREDIEITGNGYLEVLRDGRERIAQFERLPSTSVRLMPRDKKLTKVTVPVRTAPLMLGSETKNRRFRTFLQIVGNAKTYFKSFGDPRVMSADTGRVFKNQLDLKKAEPKSRAATEVIHFRIGSDGAYGIPRWIGSTFAVLGTTASEHVNYLYFDNKGVPPMALLVSGAKVSDSSVKKIEDYIETNVKGVKNFHKMLVIQAETQQGSDPDQAPPGRIRIELKPLTQAQQSDALFQKYDERNADKVGQQFRLPRIVRGDVRDFNRATAESALEFAEGQIFGPLRNDFDFTMTRLVLQNELRSVYFTFASNAIQLRDPEKVAGIIAELTKANVLVPADARSLVEDLVFYRKLRRIDADWVNQPPMLTQTGMLPDPQRDGVIPQRAPGGDGGAAPARMTDRQKAIRALLNMRDELGLIEAKAELEELRAAKAAGSDGDAKPVESDDDGEVVVTMPLDEMIKRFELTPEAA